VITAATIRVPESLAGLDQWIVWRYEQHNGGKPTKVPHQINGVRASTTNPKMWRSWDDALKALLERPEHWSGIGFVFSPNDPFFGIDLDQCLDAAGRLKPWAQPIAERFSDSYAEISPSGQGIKIWAKGKLPGGGVAFPLDDGRVEIYDRARYFTVTGKPDARYRGAPKRSRLAAWAVAARPEESAIHRERKDLERKPARHASQFGRQ
jgi:putative DNA primase/helicase